jgi:hypothetical protein
MMPDADTENNRILKPPLVAKNRNFLTSLMSTDTATWSSFTDVIDHP